jgi:hypothetical protein
MSHSKLSSHFSLPTQEGKCERSLSVTSALRFQYRVAVMPHIVTVLRAGPCTVAFPAACAPFGFRGIDLSFPPQFTHLRMKKQPADGSLALGLRKRQKRQ